MISKTDFLHDIINVYTKPGYDYANLYRYVKLDEFENLFEKHFLTFTNPKNWKPTDKYETYFEEWWFSKEHLRAAYYQIKKMYRGLNDRMTARYGDAWNNEVDTRATFLDIVARVALLQQKTFCYCLADRYDDPKMVAEYHNKWKRNVILKFSPCCFQKISLFGAQPFSIGKCPSLNADFFPMSYSCSIEQFIASILPNNELPNRKDISKKLLETGLFLKHYTFAYEHEIRLRLSIIDPQIINGTIFGDVYNKVSDIEDEEAFFEECMSIISCYKEKFCEVYKQVSDQIFIDGDKEYFRLSLETDNIRKLIDKIIVFNGISETEYESVEKYSALYNIPITKIC